jgi:hypothetical protein
MVVADHPGRPGRRPGDGDGPPGPDPEFGPSGGGGGEGDRGRPTRSHRAKWFIVAVVVVLAAVVIGVAGETMKPAKTGPRVLTDRQYMKLANDECAKALPDLRPADTGPFGKTATPAQTAAQIDHAAGGLDALADRLAALPASAVDRPHVTTWLDGWHRYSGLGRQYAEFLRQHGSANPGRLLSDSVQEAKSVDAFALANGLSGCTFLATPQPDPSNGF